MVYEMMLHGVGVDIAWFYQLMLHGVGVDVAWCGI